MCSVLVFFFPCIGKGPLSGQVALVTGASSGIGRATAAALAAAGAKVSLAARRADLLQEAVKAIKNDNGEAMGMEADVTSMEQVRKQKPKKSGVITKRTVSKILHIYGGISPLLIGRMFKFFFSWEIPDLRKKKNVKALEMHYEKSFKSTNP